MHLIIESTLLRAVCPTALIVKASERCMKQIEAHRAPWMSQTRPLTFTVTRSRCVNLFL